MPNSSGSGDLLADAVRAGVIAHADPAYVAGTVVARKPGKPVRGVRIPVLRAVVRDAVRAHRPNTTAVISAANRLWTGEGHEEELAACMLLRLTGTPVTVDLVAQWAPLLDNWLSVDELGGLVGQAVTSDPAMAKRLAFLGEARSPWCVRLYVVSAIRPVREGLDPAAVPALTRVMQAPDDAVRKAAIWLLRETLSRRPSSAQQFLAVWPDDAARPLTRRLHAHLAQVSG